MLVSVLLDVVVPVGCVAVCALIGRHYERRCAEHRAYCDDIEHNTYQFAKQAERHHAGTRTDVIPIAEPPLRTHDQLYAGRTTGRHALPDHAYRPQP